MNTDHQRGKNIPPIPKAVDDAAKRAFGRRVEALMHQRGWKPSELGRRAGLERNRISAYINGKSRPSRAYLVKLATALRVKPEDLLPEAGYSSATTGDAPCTAVFSPDNTKMRIVADVWLPSETGAEILRLISSATTDGG